MPFVSQAQRRWMYANHPEMALRWEAHTPKDAKLPERKTKKKKKGQEKKAAFEDVLELFGVKEARHSLDRIQERTSLDPNLIPLLEAEADRLSDQVPPGFYYLPLNGPHGELQGYAAFKTVPGYPHQKLVLATVLGPNMTPKGTSLAHLFPQPKLAAVFNPDEGKTPYDRVVRRQFNELASLVHDKGVLAGTAHKRIIIPKHRVTEQDILNLGFQPVTIAIPEAGQDRFQSFRHPDNNFHIHSHPDGWTMHEDSHAAATMLAKKAKNIKHKAKAMIDGIPHVSEEGLPGLYYYIKGALGGHKSTAQRVFKELPTEAKLKLYGMTATPLAAIQNIKAQLQAQREKLSAAISLDLQLRAKMATLSEEIEKIAAPRWAKELSRSVSGAQAVHAAGNAGTAMEGYAKSLGMAKRIANAGIKQRTLGLLGHGADASAHLVAGMIPGSAQPGISAMKFLGRSSGFQDKETFKRMLTERSLASKVLSDLGVGAESYGIHYSPQKGGGAVEYQEFAPFKADPQTLQSLRSSLTGKTVPGYPDKQLWDVADHDGNVRVNGEGKPVVIDARFDDPARGATRHITDTVEGRRLGVERQGISALRDAMNGKTERIEPPAPDRLHKYRNYLIGGGLGTAALGGYAAYRNFGESEKVAASALRSRFQLKAPTSSPHGGIFEAYLGDRRIGQMSWGPTNALAGDMTPKIHRAMLEPEFQGMGLGKKMYMDAAQHLGGTLRSDSVVSDQAKNVWDSLARHYNVNEVSGLSAAPRTPKYELNVPENIPTKPPLSVMTREERNQNIFAKFEPRQIYSEKNASALVIEGLIELREKIARVLTSLQPHQQRVVDRMADPDQPGLVAVHGLGSGKTLTSIAVADKLGLPADVVVPAALQENYAKEQRKHTDTTPDTRILSLENTARKGPGMLERPLMIVDEAHRMRNPGKTRSTLMASPAEKRLLLTGSLVYNNPADMAPLINTVAGEKTLPQDPSEFAARYIRERQVGPGFWGSLTGKPGSTVVEVNPKHKQELQDILKKYVDYHPGSTEGFPTREDQVVKVPMTEHQRKLDDALMADMPPWAREKILKNLPPSKSEAQQLNAFMSAVRQNANTTHGFDMETSPHQPKIERAVDELRKLMQTNPKAKAVIYSNYLDSGINPYKALLEQNKIPYGEFSGQMTKSQREELVRQYNDDKLKALLLSSAGGEGLDLKGTNLIQVLEPHWNEEKIKQVIGRGIRFKSHDHLPEEQRKVLVQRFLATRPRQGIAEKLRLKDPGGSADEFLYNRSNEKEHLNSQFRDLLR
jgi:superfamily II DNA or RNA helicase